MYLRTLAKAILPERIIHFIRVIIRVTNQLLNRATNGLLGRRRIRKHLEKYKGLSIEDTFDEIYRSKVWAGETDKLSGEGSYGEWAARYIELLLTFIKNNHIKSITDIGCGDFNIGKDACNFVEKYFATDVSREIIERNRIKFKKLKNVEFIHANACIDPIPQADLVTIRQVLQHLTNQQIESILENIEKSGAKFALVTEHMVRPDRMAAPNIDLPSQSAVIRTALRSGVLINEWPFSRSAKSIATFAVVTASRDWFSDDEILSVFLWDIGAHRKSLAS